MTRTGYASEKNVTTPCIVCNILKALTQSRFRGIDRAGQKSAEFNTCSRNGGGISNMRRDGRGVPAIYAEENFE